MKITYTIKIKPNYLFLLLTGLDCPCLFIFAKFPSVGGGCSSWSYKLMALLGLPSSSPP